MIPDIGGGYEVPVPYIFIQNFISKKYVQVIKLCLFILVKFELAADLQQ
jgi:hypothetical protein